MPGYFDETIERTPYSGTGPGPLSEEITASIPPVPDAVNDPWQGE